MININPKEIYEKLEKSGQKWVLCNAKAKLLEDSFKSELSYSAQEFLNNGAKSMADAESKARACPWMFNYIFVMTQARKEADQWKVRYENRKVWFDALRTQASTMRAELQALPGTK